MSNSSSPLSRRARLNVPSPNPERGSYARFIPREELGTFANWNPGSFSSPECAAAAAVPANPPAPTDEEWLARIEAARQAGYQDGYRDGTAALDGFKRSHAEQADGRLARFMHALDAEFDALHARLAESVTRVSLQLARQVLRSELQAVPSHVSKVAADAIEAVLLSARHITVYVHPLDLPLVGAGVREVLQARGARLVAQPDIERGGCRVESDAGAIDARIATRWSQAAGALGSQEPWTDDGAVGAPT